MSEPKFKIGDRVKIYRCANPHWWNEDGKMHPYIGEIRTITAIEECISDSYVYWLDNLSWVWDEDSLCLAHKPNEQLLFDFMYD